jgi:uncharacterized alkaline shock family protein YloU
MVEAPNSPSTLDGSVTRVIAGSTTIDAGVIATVAGIAANGVDGVYAVSNAAPTPLGVIREALDLTDRGAGVTIEFDGSDVRVGVTLVAEYPLSMRQVITEVRLAVCIAVEEIIGLGVAEVNVIISDVHIPGDDEFDRDHPAEH